MKTKSLTFRYLPKFKRELSEGITPAAIINSIVQMLRVEQITESQAHVLVDCLWIARSQLRESNKLLPRGSATKSI